MKAFKTAKNGSKEQTTKGKNEMTELSPALVRRLPQYFRALIKFYGNGKERISSEELASELGLVPSQVRTDIKALGCTGQKSYGYVIASLYKKIADILQLSDKFSAVIVGTSDTVKAVSKSEIFTKRGIKLGAIFSETEKSCDGNDRQILPFDMLEGYLSEKSPDIIILGASAEKTLLALDIAEKSCKKPTVVWNFTELSLSSECLTVKNIHLSDHLMLLCYDLGKSLNK